MAIPLPGLDTPLVDPQSGRMSPIWYDYFRAHQKLTEHPDVSTTAPTNGQTLVYVAATKLWTPT